jgi:hypothetical protein
MHWAQIGKTLFEVFRDENAPALDSTICEAVTHLQYYSGEFDVEWGNDVVYGKNKKWHNELIDDFNAWLKKYNYDPCDTNLSLGYLPLGQIPLQQTFGTTNEIQIRSILSKYLDIYKIEVDDVYNIYDYCWTDFNYKQMQIDMMRPGYDYNSRR